MRDENCHHAAGTCLPLFEPSGCREHDELVRLEIEDAELPQYLHVYLALSSPSYTACLPSLLPSGWRGHELLVRLEIDDAELPQCLQKYFAFSSPS